MTPDLRRYLATLRRQWRLALAIVTVCAGAAYVMAWAQTPSYTATAKVLLDQDRRVDALLGTDGYSPDPERELNTAVLLITQQPIVDRVRRSLGLDGPARVSAAADRSSSIVAITATDGDPERAARIASAFAAAYRGYRSEAARQAVGDALASARARRSSLDDRRAQLELDAEIRRLETMAAFRSSGVQLVQSASASDATRRPRPMVAGFVGGFLGLLLAAVAVVVLARTDPRVREERDVELAAGRPVISATALALSLRGPVVLLLGEGAAEAACEVARALAVGDRSAIVVERGDSLQVETARAEAEVVLLAGDALGLTTLADEVVLVARLGVTRADRLSRALRELGVVGMPPTAVLVVDKRAQAHHDVHVARRQEVAVG